MTSALAFDLALAALVLAIATLTIAAREAMSAVISFIAYGLLLSLAWVRLRAPDGYRIPPHTHPKTERLTVISGTFRLGMGEKFAPDELIDMPAGSYGFWPAGMTHFVQVRGETVVQLHGIGPWQIVYVNPSDDPRRSGR